MVDKVRGTFEIHIFCAPINPSPELAAKFDATCREETAKSGRTMKGLNLFLDFEHLGFASVLQSSRYCAGDLEHARKVRDEDTAILRAAGFEVIRQKIECLASNTGVPDDAKEAELMPKSSYFEYHIAIRPVEEATEAFPEEDMLRLREISQRLSKELGCRIPLSYNAFKPSQRFLNARTYDDGRKESFGKVDKICEEIVKTGTMRVEKVIREYIVDDDHTEVDAGWLEPLDFKSKR